MTNKNKKFKSRAVKARRRRKDPHQARESKKYERPIPSREFILSTLIEHDEPLNLTQLSYWLELVDERDIEALKHRVKAMLRDKQLERYPRGLLWPTDQHLSLTGRVIVSGSDYYLIPEDRTPKILIQAASVSIGAGDKVVITIPSAKKLKDRIGKVIDVIEQANRVITGRYTSSRDAGFVIPNVKLNNQDDIYIEAEHRQNAQDGDIVVVDIITTMPVTMGKITKVLGNENQKGIEIDSAVCAFDLPYIFSDEIKDGLKKYPKTVTKAACRGREDFRDLPFVTIDGEDARDFDDAVYCQPKRSGGFKLYVAIADVSHYVKANSLLDKEANLRGNSVYFPSRVIPMLPEVLSNELCSLKPEVDRLVMVCEMSISAAGELTRSKFFEGVICSKARLTYTKVAAILNHESTILRKQYSELLPQLEDLHQLYQLLYQARVKRGAIEFETTETKVLFNKKGKISSIEPVTRNVAHKIIEECMLAANVACAKFLKKHKIPGLYRVHEPPPDEKLVGLREYLKELGLSLGSKKVIDKPTALDYGKLIDKIKHREDAQSIQMVLLRSMSQAVYSPDNIGHFGLAYHAYTHFTSPIRRYPDLIVHRQIRKILRGKWDKENISEKAQIKEENLMSAVCEHCSYTERRADEATRDTLRWLKCQYLAKRIGEDFDAMVAGVTRFGLFVELKPIYMDGLIHISSLAQDYFHFDPVSHTLQGERTGQIFRLGDSMRVRIAQVDIDERKVDLQLLSGLSAKKSIKSKKNKQRQNKKPEKFTKSKRVKSNKTKETNINSKKNKQGKNKVRNKKIKK